MSAPHNSDEQPQTSCDCIAVINKDLEAHNAMLEARKTKP